MRIATTQDKSLTTVKYVSSRKISRGETARDERGSVLVLALLFLVAISLVLTALASWATNDLNNSTKFSAARSLQFAPLLASGQTLNASPANYCWGSGPTSELAGASSVDGVAVEVWCSTVWAPSSADTRVVTFSTCLAGVSAGTCALNPVLQSVVAFDDYPPGVSTPNNGVCAVYCGTGLTIESWLWSPHVPTVSSINPTSGAVISNTTITLKGTGFVTGTTVNFVEETGSTPSSANVILEATGVVLAGSTSLSAVVPTVLSGGSYFVTVTTPSGTSAYGPIFTYS